MGVWSGVERDAANVRFGSLADILTSPRHVRFTPNNGRWAAHPSQHLAVGFMSTCPSSTPLSRGVADAVTNRDHVKKLSDLEAERATRLWIPNSFVPILQRSRSCLVSTYRELAAANRYMRTEV